MKIYYVHHALRDMGNPPTQEDGLKELGIEDAKITSKIFEESTKYLNIKAIYTSNFLRCKETARIINENLNVPVIEDARFNECGSVFHGNKRESWEECQIRIMEAIKDIVFKYDEKDAVLCVTSGVNLTAFINIAFNLSPSSKHPYPMVASCSPIGFEINRNNFIK